MSPDPFFCPSGDYRVDPRQRLLRLDFAVAPSQCRQGENAAAVRLLEPVPGTSDARVALEKLEAHLRYE